MATEVRFWVCVTDITKTHPPNQLTAPNKNTTLGTRIVKKYDTRFVNTFKLISVKTPVIENYVEGRKRKVPQS